MTDPTNHPTWAENPGQTVAKLLTSLGKFEDVLSPEDSSEAFVKPTIITLPEGRTTHDMTSTVRAAAEYFKPARRRGTAHLTELESLIQWTNRFKGESSVLYANPDPDAPTLTCIADYHEQGPATLDPTGDPTARHGAHRAVYNFPLSDEWKAWMAASDKPMEKDELGEFIEANAKGIMDPTPAILGGAIQDAEPWEQRMIETASKINGRFAQLHQLLAMTKKFQVFETSDLTLKTNRDTGETEIAFLNEHKGVDGKPLNIPNLLIITIPVFRGGTPYRMPVRFRYRKNGSTIRFILSVYNPERSFEAAFKEAITTATEETGLPTFMGRPESA